MNETLKIDWFIGTLDDPRVKQFEEEAKAYHAYHLKRVTDRLSDEDKAWVMEWYECRQRKEFWEVVPRTPHSAILELCSAGLG